MKSKNPKKNKEDKKKTKEYIDLNESEVTQETPQNLGSQVQKLLAEKQDLFEKLQRVSADYINYQKRAPKQVAESVAYEKKAIIRSLLPSLDNFSHALASAGNAKGEKALDGVVKGVQLVFDHMIDALKSHGVEKIAAMGEEFNPAFHEAMQMRTEEDKPNNVILEEFQKGYTLNGQVLRPSKVIVNKLAEKKTEGPKESKDQTDPADKDQQTSEE